MKVTKVVERLGIDIGKNVFYLFGQGFLRFFYLPFQVVLAKMGTVEGSSACLVCILCVNRDTPRAADHDS